MPYANPADRRRYEALYKREKKARERSRIIELLGSACARCGFTDVRALVVDHVNGGGTAERKRHGGNIYAAILRKVEAGSDEYQVLCCNCNEIKKHENGEQRYRVHEDTC